MNILLHLALIAYCFALITCEIITGAMVIGSITGLGTAYYKYMHCKYFECCTEDYIHLDLTKLDKLLSNHLFGQHIAHKVIKNALMGYFNENEQSKALSLSFHGTPGTGKNYAAKFIAESLFKKGTESKYFHFFNGRIDFPLKSDVEKYKANLQATIMQALSDCPQSLFVFDEIDKMPEGVLNILVPFLDYNTWSTKGSVNKAIFIFLSNTGSRHIVNQLITLWEKGVKREDTKLQDFEHLISLGAFNEIGGFHLSDTIESNVIDHYIPFLPLEETHIKKCVNVAFLRRGTEPSSEMVEEAISHMIFDPSPHNLYSKSGCKRVDQKVAAIMYAHKLS